MADDTLKKTSNKKALKSKRMYEPEKSSNEETFEYNQNNSSKTNDHSTDENSFKKFKIDIPLEFNNNVNKLKLKAKKNSKKYNFREKFFAVKSEDDLNNVKKNDSNERRDDLDESENYEFGANDNNQIYNSEDEQNSSIDNENSSVGSNLNPNVDDEPSSNRLNFFASNSSPSSISSSTSTTNNSQFLKLNPLTNYPNFSSNILQQQSDFFTNLFSNLPLNSDSNTNNSGNNGNSTFQISNLAAALVQRLTNTAAFVNSYNNSNNTNNNNNNNDIKNLSNNSKGADNGDQKVHKKNDDSSKKQDNEKTIIKSNLNTCALDLSVKNIAKKIKSEENSDDPSAKSKFANLLSNKIIKQENDHFNNDAHHNSYTKNSEENASDNQRQKNKNLDIGLQNNNKKAHGNKGIIDVINRLSSRSKTNDESNNSLAISQPTDLNNLKKKSNKNNLDESHNELEKFISLNDCDKNEHDSNLEELNELIKSHLLPLSEAAIKKYREYFNSKKLGENLKCLNEEDEEMNETESNLKDISSNEESSNVLSENCCSAVSSLSSSALNSSLIDNTSNKTNNQCTFCNILKNLMDLHVLLHKE